MRQLLAARDESGLATPIKPNRSVSKALHASGAPIIIIL
jgi:hypothetical protein